MSLVPPPAQSRASFIFRQGCSKPEPEYLSVTRDEGPTASMGPSSNVWPWGNFLTRKIEYKSATAHLDKALNRLKKRLYWLCSGFPCSKIGDEELELHVRHKLSCQAVLLPPYHQCSHPSCSAVKGRDQSQHLSCQILLSHQTGWLKTSLRCFSFWKQFCLQSPAEHSHCALH